MKHCRASWQKKNQNAADAARRGRGERPSINKNATGWPVMTYSFTSISHLPQRPPVYRGVLAGLMLMASLCAAHAAGETPFSALYDLGPARTVDAIHVSVRLSVRIRNHGNTSLSNATIALADRLQPGLPGTPLETGVSVPKRGTVKVSSNVTVESQEYRHWQRGEAPSLIIRSIGQDGRTVDRTIELVRRQGIGDLP